MSAAGFYHCSVKSVGRANGRSVVAAAAYRSGERIADRTTGETFDYRARGGVIDTFIIAPSNAPAWAHDRERLWNEAEGAEPRMNGRLATELELALPHELTPEQRKQLVKDHLTPIIERYGVAVDVAIHEPGEGRDQRNVHAHILVTHRTLGPDGFEDVSNARTVMKKNKQGEFRETTIYGIAANPSDVMALRKDWEQAINRAYERAGLDIRTDHRSHQDRGIELDPTKHLGPTAAEIERRQPGTSDRGEVNRTINAGNAERLKLAALEAEERKLTAEIIDLKAARAEREAREAARGRYDRLRDTHSDVARDQHPGRYDDLKAATPPPEVVREFAANSNRAGEPVAPVYDRDADNAAWEAALADAAIAKGDAKIPEAETSRPASEHAPASEDMRPLGKTPGDIRMAWSLTRITGDLEEALAARGITLARVTPEEASQSERTAAFAQEVGNVARVLREDEVVAVNARGDVYRLDTRTTGDERSAIEGRLAGLDLLSVTDAKEAMQEAAREAWGDERRAAWEKARPPTGIETTIAEALKSTKTGHDFAAAMDDAGITIARATDADVKALDTLRQDAGLAALVSHTEDELDRVRHFATLQAGDFAAVTRAGDVFRLNPHQVDLQDAEQRLADTQSRLPSVTEARAISEINREATADLWAERRANKTAADVARAEAIEARENMRGMAIAAERSVDQVIDAAEDTLDLGSKVAGGSVSRFAKFVENMLEGLFSFFGAGDAKLSPQQAELEGRAAEEHAQERAIAAAEAENQAAIDRIIAEQDRKQQQDKLHAEIYGRFPDLTLDPSRSEESGRERERERD